MHASLSKGLDDNENCHDKDHYPQQLMCPNVPRVNCRQ